MRQKELKIINNTAILLTNTTIGKAYLQVMLNNGYITEKVILLNWNNIKKNDSLLLKLFKKLPAKWQLLLFHFHSKGIKNKISFNVYQNVKSTLSRSKIHFEILPCKSINDNNVVEFIKKIPQNLLIYTGGGIVRKPLLNLKKNILHVHPGILPYIRGSNGLFWSILERNKPGFTCFLMNEGIDTGNIICSQEFEMPRIKIPYLFSRLMPNTNLYFSLMALENCYVSYYRAVLLLNVLKNYYLTGTLHQEEQNTNVGKTYYTMHYLLVNNVLKKIRC